MDLTDLAPHEERAVLHLLQAWLARWDPACAAQFGLQQARFRDVLARWPRVLWDGDPSAALAVGGALRATLHCLDDTARQQMLDSAGLTLNEASALLDDMAPRIQHALEPPALHGASTASHSWMM